MPSLTFEFPVLTIPKGGTILAPLHKALMPKLKIMGTFPLMMRSVPKEIGDLNMRYLEITSSIQDIQHLVSLPTSDTPSKLLILTETPCHQLEVGAEYLLISFSYAKLHEL